MSPHGRRKTTWLIIGLLSLALMQSCGGGGGGGIPGDPVVPVVPVVPTESASKSELTDPIQLTTDSYITSASNGAGQVLVLVAHGDDSVLGTTEIRALQYTSSGGWEKPITVASSKTVPAVQMAAAAGLGALVISDSGDAIFAWQYDPPLSGLGYDLWTVARIGGVWQSPTLLTNKTGLATYSLTKDPSNQSVAGVLWEEVTGDHALYFSRYRSTSGWDAAEPVAMLLGGETSSSILDSKLGMDNSGNQYVAVTGNYDLQSGIRVRRRTVTGWEDPQQIYTYDKDKGEYSPFVIHFAVAPSGKAMIAYSKTGTAADNFAPYYRTFSYDGTLWSGKMDTPLGVRADTVFVDNTGSAALVSDISGACFKPSAGWSAVATLNVPTNAGSSWSPCLESGGVATWSDVLTSVGKPTTHGYWIAKIGTAGWSQEHLLTADGSTEPVVAIHISMGTAIVLYEKYDSPATLWAGRWATPVGW